MGMGCIIAVNRNSQPRASAVAFNFLPLKLAFQIDDIHVTVQPLTHTTKIALPHGCTQLPCFCSAIDKSTALDLVCVEA